MDKKTSAPAVDHLALVSMANDMRAEQTYLGSCRETCDNSGKLRWDRVQRVIDYLERDGLAPAVDAPTGAPEGYWRDMSSAPRDGSNILIRFGKDVVSQAKYVPGVPHPWKFIDTQDGMTWLINHAVDNEYGPTHWAPLPTWGYAEPSDVPAALTVSVSEAAAGEINQCDGCRCAAPLTERGIHQYSDGSFIACTKGRYTAPPAASGQMPYPARLLHESDASLAWRVDSWHERNPTAASGQKLTDEQIVQIGHEYFRPGHDPKAVTNFVKAVRACFRAMTVDLATSADVESDIAADRHYIAGVKAGWNLCDADDEKGFQACIEGRQSQIQQARALLRASSATASDKEGA